MPLSPDPLGKGPVLSLLPAKPEATTREEAIRLAPGMPVVLLRPAPVKVRARAGLAIAYTVTHVLVECCDNGDYQLRWEASWLVRKL